MKSHLKERIYLSLPVFCQNILVSIAGAIEHHRRYGGIYEQLSKELISNEFDSRNDIDARSDELLQQTLQHALTTVPYYKALNIPSVSIEQFPPLNRVDVAESPEQFISSKYAKKNLFTIHTGGSTGTPLGIYINKNIRRKSYAFWNRFYQSFGFHIGDKKATFLGRKIQEPENNTSPFWRYNFIDKQLLFSSYHMTEDNLSIYVEKLNHFKPVVIEGYPLSVFRIASYVVKNEIPLTFTPNGICTSSENLSQKQREIMERAFNCKVYDQYGSAESAVFAADCEYGNKHIAVEYGLVEVINKKGEISREGEGELLVTSLLNDAMPLIRYKIGDLGVLSNKACPCKRNTPILEELSGKVGAVLVSQGKQVPTAAIAFAFEYLDSISKAQVIQNEAEKIIVKLVANDKYDEDQEEFMKWELRKMLSKNLAIDVELVDDIPAGENGKYKMIVQNYYKDTL